MYSSTFYNMAKHHSIEVSTTFKQGRIDILWNSREPTKGAVKDQEHFFRHQEVPVRVDRKNATYKCFTKEVKVVFIF